MTTTTTTTYDVEWEQGGRSSGFLDLTTATQFAQYMTDERLCTGVEVIEQTVATTRRAVRPAAETVTAPAATVADAWAEVLETKPGLDPWGQY